MNKVTEVLVRFTTFFCLGTAMLFVFGVGWLKFHPEQLKMFFPPQPGLSSQAQANFILAVGIAVLALNVASWVADRKK